MTFIRRISLRFKKVFENSLRITVFSSLAFFAFLATFFFCFRFFALYNMALRGVVVRVSERDIRIVRRSN